jgi:hypothetical protein
MERGGFKQQGDAEGFACLGGLHRCRFPLYTTCGDQTPRNFCCNFVNESKSLQNTTNDNQHQELSSSRRRTDLAENEDDTETGVRDLKSFVLNGTCGFDPHPGHFCFVL